MALAPRLVAPETEANPQPRWFEGRGWCRSEQGHCSRALKRRELSVAPWPVGFKRQVGIDLPRPHRAQRVRVRIRPSRSHHVAHRRSDEWLDPPSARSPWVGAAQDWTDLDGRSLDLGALRSEILRCLMQSDMYDGILVELLVAVQMAKRDRIQPDPSWFVGVHQCARDADRVAVFLRRLRTRLHAHQDWDDQPPAGHLPDRQPGQFVSRCPLNHHPQGSRGPALRRQMWITSTVPTQGLRGCRGSAGALASSAEASVNLWQVDWSEPEWRARALGR